MPFLIPRSHATTLDANGNGQVEFSIDNTNQRWSIDAMSLHNTAALDSTPVPRVDIYQNTISGAGFRGGTDNGIRDVATGRLIMYPDDVIYVTWTGGIPGSEVAATIDGTFDPAGVPIQDN